MWIWWFPIFCLLKKQHIDNVKKKKTNSSCESPEINWPYKSMRLKNPKKHYKGGAKENIWTTYYKCRAIYTETGGTGRGAFFE